MTLRLEVRNITYIFKDGGLLAKDFSLIFPDDPIVGVVGRNGVGKTILGQIVVGLRKTSKGEVLLGDEVISTKRPSLRSKKVNFLFQHSRQAFSFNTVIQEVIFSLQLEQSSLSDHEMKTRALEWLEKYGLSEKAAQNPFSLSGGERRKLSLILLEIRGPRLVIYDEPTVGLDRLGLKLLSDSIRQGISKGGRALVITNNIEYLLGIARSFVLIERSIKENSILTKYSGSIVDYFIRRSELQDPVIAEPYSIGLYRKYLAGSLPRESAEWFRRCAVELEAFKGRSELKLGQHES